MALDPRYILTHLNIPRKVVRSISSFYILFAWVIFPFEMVTVYMLHHWINDGDVCCEYLQLSMDFELFHCLPLSPVMDGSGSSSIVGQLRGSSFNLFCMFKSSSQLSIVFVTTFPPLIIHFSFCFPSFLQITVD